MEQLTIRSGPAIGVAGRAANELAPGAPPRDWSIPDHHLSEFGTEALEVRAATSRGLMHRRSGTERQDEYSVTSHKSTGQLLVVVCDGVGSLPDSSAVAAHICEDLPERYASCGDLGLALLETNRGLLRKVAGGGLEGASTVVCVAIRAVDDGLEIDAVSVGDSSGWTLDPLSGVWEQIGGERGEGALHDTTVRPLPDASLTDVWRRQFVTSCPIFLMTDGVSGPLSGSSEVKEVLAGWWGTAPNIFEFGAQVAFARKSHHDDRTVVGIWPKAGVRKQTIDQGGRAAGNGSFEI